MRPITPVLLCGGVGSRLWPVSRQGRPKQYLNLIGEQSMLQQTLERLDGLDQTGPIVVCNEEHRFLVAEQLRQLSIEEATIILEPEGKNTAPAIALAAHAALASDPDSLLLVLPADHHIGRPEDLRAAVGAAVEVASDQKLVTFGLIPSRPETGYGYIKRGAAITENAAELETFVEKPDIETAEAYLATGDYVWNSGMFMFSAEAYLASLASSQPKMAAACRESMNASERDIDFRKK